MPITISGVTISGGMLFSSSGEGQPTNLSAPIISGTLTNGSILTCTPGVWSSGTATRQWFRDGVMIVGQTGLTYTYNATTDDGCYLTVMETNGGISVTSNALLGIKSAPAPVTLNPADNPTNIGLSGGNLTVIKIAGSGDQCVRSTVAASNKVGFRYTVTNPHNTVVGVAPTSMATNGWVGMVLGSVGYAAGGPIYHNGSQIATGAAWASGDIIDVMIDVPTRKIWFARNGTWQNGDPAAGSGGATIGGSGGIFAAWSNNNTLGTGTFNFVSIASVSGFTPYDPTILPIRISTTSVNAATDPTITATGSTDNTPTQLQVAVISSTGQILLNWADVNGLSGASYNITSPGISPAAQGQTVKFYIRDKIIKNTAVTADVTVGYYAGIYPTIIGLNEDYWYPFGQANPFVDYGSIGEWYSPSVGGDNILPTANRNSVTNLPSSYYGSDTYVEWAVGIADQYSFLTAGAYVITYPAGMTAVAGVLENASVTTPFSGGSGVVTVSGSSGAVIRVRLSGTIPVGGVTISMKKQGETSTKLYTTQIANDYTEAGFKIARFMTPFGTNTLPRFPITSSTLQYNSSIDSAPGLNPAYMVQFCNDNAVDLYFNVHHLANDAYVTAAANYFAANLNSNRKIYIELSNEMWNPQFPSHDYSRMTGSALGFYNTLGNAAPSTIVAGQFDTITGATSVAYTSGTRIFGNLSGTGWQVWEAVGNQSIGSVLGATSNANWTVIANNGQTATAGRRWQAKRSKEIFALFDAAFGATARTRTIRVLGVWAAADNTTTLGERLQWDNLFQNLDRVAIAPYWGGDLGDYTGNHLPGWGATEKALYATDLTAWKNAFFSVVNADVDATVARATTFKQNLESALRQAPYNLPADTIRLMSYECGWHVTMGSYPNQTLAVTAFNSLRDDARYATATTRYLNGIKAQIGGEHVWFSSVTKPIPSATGRIWGWGIMYKQGDRTMPLYNAIKTWIAASQPITNITAPIISGTLTNGSTITCTPGVWSSGTATRQWFRDGVAIAGQTGMTYTYNATTDDGTYLTVIETNGGITATSNALIDANKIYTMNMNPTNGTSLGGYEGWQGWSYYGNGAATVTNMTFSGGALRANDSNQTNFRRDFGASNYAIEVIPTFDHTNNANVREFNLRWTNASNCIIVRLYSNSLLVANNASAGGGGVIMSDTGVSLNNKVVRLQLSGNYLRVFIDGIEHPTSAAASGGLGLNVSPVPVTNFVVLGLGGNAQNGTPYSLWTSLNVSAVPAASLTVSSSQVQAPTVSTAARLTASGKIVGSITQLQALAISPTGKILNDWTDVSGISGSDYTVNWPNVPTEAQGKTISYYLRDKTNKNSLVKIDKFTNYFAPVGAMSLGMNSSGHASYGASDIVRNRVMQARWLFGPNFNVSYSTTGWDSTDPLYFIDKKPRGNVTPPGLNRLALLLFESTKPRQTGTWRVNFPPGMVVVFGNYSTNVTPGTINNAAGWVEFTINTLDPVDLWLHWNDVANNPPTAGWPANGLDITCYPNSDTNRSRVVTDQFIGDYGSTAGFKSYRWMKGPGTERLDAPASWWSADFVAQASNLMNVKPYITIPVHWTDTEATTFLSNLNATLNPSLGVIVEYGNEIWNGFYGAQRDYLMWLAASQGLTANVPTSAIRAHDWVSPDTGVLNRSVTSGQILVTYGVNWQSVAVRALRNVASGTAIPGITSNADFEILAKYAELYEGVYLLQARKQKWLGQQARSIFGTNRAESVFGCWQLHSATDLGRWMSFENAYTAIDWYMPSTYCGVFRAFNSSTYDQYYVSNKVLYKNSLFADITTDVNNMVNSLQNMKHGVETYFRATTGALGATPQIGSYEGGMNVGYSGGIPDANAMVATLTECKQDSRWADAQTLLFTGIREKLGGHHVMFVDYEDWAVTYSGIVQTFGALSQSSGLRTNEQYYNALRAFALANT